MMPSSSGENSKVSASLFSVMEFVDASGITLRIASRTVSYFFIMESCSDKIVAVSFLSEAVSSFPACLNRLVAPIIFEVLFKECICAPLFDRVISHIWKTYIIIVSYKAVYFKGFVFGRWLYF